MAWLHPLLLLTGVLASMFAAACSTRPAVRKTPLVESSDIQRYTWLESSCSDGRLELAQLGFERTLEVLPVPDGLELTLESTLATRGCRSTAIVYAEREPDGGYLFTPEAHVTLPESADCEAEETEIAHGTVRRSGERLVITTQRSAWCRGLDARFVYVPVARTQLLPEQLARRYAASFHRGHATRLAALFASDGTLIEPFTRTADGSDARHEGRKAISEYFASAFGSVAWHALRVTSIEPGNEAGALTLRFAYMDSALAQPLHGRTSMLVVGGELLQVETQLEEDPRPRVEPAMTGP